jgi:hypothetical protein
MSTKIYGGRMIAAPIGRAYDMLLAARPQAVAIGTDLQHAWMARRAVELIDAAALKGEVVGMPIIAAWQELLDGVREIRSTQRRRPDIDFEFELWLFPLGRRTLMLVHTEQSRMREWVDALPFVVDHSYWDNTDRDEDVDARTWASRRRDWEKALPGAGVPSDRSLTMTMFNHDFAMPPKASEALRHAPTLDARVATLARRRHIDEVYSAMLEQARSEDSDYRPEGFGAIIEAIGRADRDDDRRAAIVAETAPLLEEMTVAMLDGPEGVGSARRDRGRETHKGEKA